jgi:hypothetical protein
LRIRSRVGGISHAIHRAGEIVGDEQRAIRHDQHIGGRPDTESLRSKPSINGA